MLQEQIEGRWLEAFVATFQACAVGAEDVVAILSESQSRPVLVQLSTLALQQLGAKVFHLQLPTPAITAPVPIRSTGASDIIQGLKPVIAALNRASMVVDCSVEGVLHAPELAQILDQGPRVLMVSNEHPEVLERMHPDPELEQRVKAGTNLLRGAKRMHVTSKAGTDLQIDLTGAVAGGGWGYTKRAGTISHWPGGLCLCFPAAACVNGRLVLDCGDVNLTFKRYLESPIALQIEDDYIVAIEGAGLDAALMQSYMAAWGDREAYAVSHVGWGMNHAARWEAMSLYDKNDFNGTELRAFAGNFLYSTGANEVAGRHTLGHFDLPLRNCSLSLDGQMVVDEGILQGDLA